MEFDFLFDCHCYTHKNVESRHYYNWRQQRTQQKWSFILDHQYRKLIIGGSGSGKTNEWLNLVSQQDDINKIYSYAKDLSETKYEYLIKKCEDAGIKNFNGPNAFIECSNAMDDVYENIDDYNPNIRKNYCFWWHDCKHYEK